MLDWLGGLIGSFGGALGNVFSTFGEGIVDSIWDGLVEWMLKSFYGTISDVFTQIGGMGAEIFDLSWIVAAFDLAIEYQNGRANVKSTALNVLKGFFAANLVTLAPVELYKFCINLQNVFLKDLAGSFVGTVDFNLGDAALKVLIGKFGGATGVVLNGLFPLAMLIGLSYCVLKVFFSNIKRGGHIADTNGCGDPLSLLCPAGLYGRIQPVVQADNSALPDRVFANNAPVFGASHLQ